MEKANFIFSKFCPTFDMLYLNICPPQKCKNICVAICFRFPHNLTGLIGCYTSEITEIYMYMDDGPTSSVTGHITLITDVLVYGSMNPSK